MVKPVSSGEVKIVKDLDTVSKVDILIVEDIIDTGQTFKYIVDLLHYRKANLLRYVPSWIRKKTCQQYGSRLCGLRHSNEFVVGYGLDYKQITKSSLYRCLITRRLRKLNRPMCQTLDQI